MRGGGFRDTRSRQGRRRPRLRALAVAAATCTALGIGVSSGSGATPDTAYDTATVGSPDSQVAARFPERLIDSGDLTGDGVRDIFASSYLIDVAGTKDAGRVVMISGGDRSVRYILNSPEVQEGAQFGFYISVPGDVDGDGKEDVAVGAPYQDVYTGTGPPCGADEPNGCNENQGKAYVFSGADGRFLYDLDNPNPQADEGVFATFGARIGAAGEVTGDGVGDIVVGSPANDVPAGCGFEDPIPEDCRKNEGEAFIFNGATGALVRTLRVPAADRQEPACSSLITAPEGNPSFNRCGNIGAVQSPGDIDRDGVADQLVSAYSLRRPTAANPEFFGRLYLFSGADGEVLSRIDQPVADPNAFWGLQDLAPSTPGDVSGDGVPDLYGSGFLQDGANGESSAGRAWIFDGQKSVESGTGVVLRELADPSPRASEAFGFTASATDYNKDGTMDTYLSGLQGVNTETFVYDGRDGSLLKTLALPPGDVQTSEQGNSGSALGWSSRAPGDLNGDGEPDYVAAAPFQDVAGTQDQGRIYFFLSNVPPVPPTTPPPTDDDQPPGDGDDEDGDPQNGRIRANLTRNVSARQVGRAIRVKVTGVLTNRRGRPCAGKVAIGVRSGGGKGRGRRRGDRDRRRAHRSGRRNRRAAPSARRVVRVNSRCRYRAVLRFGVRQLPRRLRPRSARLLARVVVAYRGTTEILSARPPSKLVRVIR